MQDLNTVVNDFISSGKKSPGGVSCIHFIKVGDIGIKVYDKKRLRDNIVKKQTLAANFGFAPKVLGYFDIGQYFCYVTELAIPLLEGLSHGESNWNIIHEWNKRHNEIEDKYGSRIRNLVNEMFIATDFYMYDSHCGNFGFIDDKLVCIDFS